MSGQQQGGGGIIIIHNNSLTATTIAPSDLQTIIDSLPDGTLKTMLSDYLASLPSD